MKFIILVCLLLIYFKTFAQVLPPTDGLYAYYPMDEGIGTSVEDKAPAQAHPGTFNLSAPPTWSLAGRVDKCVEMSDNSGRRISVPSLTWTPTAFTVSFWINPYSLVNYNNQISAGIGWGGFMFHSASNGVITVGTNANTYLASSPGTIVTNTWQHFTFTYTAGVGKLYKNGQLIGSRGGMIAPVAWQGFTIGGVGPTSAIHGKVDELRIYNRALSEEEVATVAAWPHGPLITIWKSASQNTVWSNGANWIGGIAPVATSQVIVNACTICPALLTDISIDKLTININGQLNLNSKVLLTNAINLRQAIIKGNGGTIQTTKIEDIHGCSFKEGAITIKFSPIGHNGIFGGNRYEGPVTYIMSGTNNSFNHAHASTETFEEKATFINEGTGTFSVVHGPGPKNSVFKKKVVLINKGQGYMDIGNWGGGSTFQDTVIINQESTANVRIGNGQYAGLYSNVTFLGGVFFINKGSTMIGGGGNITFHGLVHLTNETGGIIFTGHSGGNVILTSTASLNLQKFTTGTLRLVNFTHQNANAVTTANIPKVNSLDPIIIIGPSSSFSGEVNFKAPNIQFNGAVFHKKAVFEKIGGNAGSSANSLGGNTFHGETIINNAGLGNWFFAQNAPDIFNGDLTVSHSGTNGTYLAHWQEGNKFKGNLTLTLTAGATGTIQLGGAGGKSEHKKADTDPGDDKTVTVNASSGNIKIGGFTQRGASTPNITLTGTANLTFWGESIFEAALDVTAPQLYLNGCLFKQPSRFIKTGVGTNNWTGGNIFKSKSTFINQATSGAINTGLNFHDMIIEDEAIIENYPFY